jgi:hypothetical protein
MAAVMGCGYANVSAPNATRLNESQLDPFNMMQVPQQILARHCVGGCAEASLKFT